MSNSISASRAWKPAVGVLTAATALAASWAPVSQALPTSGTSKTGLKVQAADAADGTFESCAAYFGFGKSDGFFDVAQFGVSDKNGSDGVAHAVPTDTHVVLVLTNTDGETLKCTPAEITKAQWDDAMDSLTTDMSASVLPAWPGPGHYAYPSLILQPSIDGFGSVKSVGFTVTSVPSGHSLVSPTGVKPLVQHHPIGDQLSAVVDPAVLDVIKSTAGQAASDAFVAALPACDAYFSDEGEDPRPFSSDLIAAVNALNTYLGYGVENAEDVHCFDVLINNTSSSTLAGLKASIAYSEPIVLALPEPPTTTSTTLPAAPSTTTAPAVHATAATPVAATPTYAG